MSTNYMYLDNYINGYLPGYLDLSSLVAIFSGILVITSKNPIISVLFLIVLFLGISGYLFLIGLNFIGLSYLLVYIGAVSILFLFILMLIDVRVSELQSETSNSLPFASIIGICFYYIISKDLPIHNSKIQNNETFTEFLLSENGQNTYKNQFITYVTSNNWDSNLTENSHITSIGNIMYTNYFSWLIITSIVLLLAMVGAIIITLRPID